MPRPQPRDYLVRTIVLCLVVPALITVAPWALLHAVGWRLPSQEVPEALGPSIQSKVTLSLGCGLFVVFWGIGAVVRRASEVARRSSAAFAAWFTWLYASDAGLAILQNIDRPAVVRTDVFQPPTIAGAIVLAALAAALAGRDRPRPSRDAVPADAARLPLIDDARAVWYGRCRMSSGAWAALATLVALQGLVIALGMRSAEPWILLVVPVLLALHLPAAGAWRVRVTADALSATSWLGQLTVTVPLADVVRADVRSVDPQSLKLNGVGLGATLDGETRVVTRPGEALTVTATGGRVYTVTVDRPDEAAAIINTLSDRARTGA